MPSLGNVRRLALHAYVAEMLALTLVFNLIDAGVTLLLINLGLATEANPWMAWLLGQSPLLFLLGKLGLVLGGAAVLWHFRQRTLAVWGSTAVCTAYAALCVYHLQSVQRIVTHLTA